MTTRIPVKEKVLADLRPYLGKLEECIAPAFDRYFRDYLPSVQADHSASVQASCIHSHVVARVRELFAKVRGAKVITVQGLDLLTLDNAQYVIRFKKLDHTGHCSNIETSQSTAFDAQEQLDGMPRKAAHLRIGYVTDKSNRKIDTLLIACPAGKQIAWTAAFGEAAESAAIPEQAPLDGGPTSRVVPKRSGIHGNVVPLKGRRNGI